MVILTPRDSRSVLDIKKQRNGASKMAQWGMLSPTKVDDADSIPETHMVEGEYGLLKVKSHGSHPTHSQIK